MVVEEVMSREPFAVEVTETVERVLRKLTEADVRHLPVVDGGMLVGIVSDRDLRGINIGSTAAQRVLIEPISTLMSSDVISVTPETDLGEVIDVMIERKIGAVPVVEADSLRLLGIVSYIDILRVARDEL